ncbi:hypothetical protein ACFVVL_03200 [Kitasatospora sp. NPDC058115]|uniref:hypothetical protein n=1 Tax=Kitasatospora sp. NPDC058115 TaxID=3346347 RepID=UPI0036D887DC
MRRNRGRLAVAAVFTALVLIGGGLWVWKPWQSVELPASACWGLIERDQVRPLVGDDGKGHETEVIGDLSGRSSHAQCGIAWQPGYTAVVVNVFQTDERSYRSDLEMYDAAPDPGRSRYLPIDFGTGVKGWLQEGLQPVLTFPCDSGRQPLARNVYRKISVSGAFFLSDLSAKKRTQVFVDVAHRTAREIVRQEGCPDVRIGERAPVVAG